MTSLRLLTTKEVAELTRMSESTVRHWRQTGTGPRGFRVGRRVLYNEREVVSWLTGKDPAGGPEAA